MKRLCWPEHTDICCKDLRRFIETHGQVQLELATRALSWEYREFLPEASYLSPDLAFPIHISGGKVYTIYNIHRMTLDGPIDTDDHLYGRAYPASFPLYKYPTPRHWNCGCSEDACLLDFYLFKTQRALSLYSTTSPTFMSCSNDCHSIYVHLSALCLSNTADLLFKTSMICTPKILGLPIIWNFCSVKDF